MEFFKKTWVTIVAVICAIISIVLFALHGFTQVDVVGLLIVAIKKLLQKKKIQETNKYFLY